MAEDNIRSERKSPLSIRSESGFDDSFKKKEIDERLDNDCLISSVVLLDYLIKEANQYVYFDEGLLLYRRNICLLYPWLVYGINLAKREHSVLEINKYLNLTTYLLEAACVDKMKGMKRGSLFVGIPDKSGMVSSYGRFDSDEVLLSNLQARTNAFFLNEELTYLFEKGDCDLRIKTLSEIESVLWDTGLQPKEWSNVFVIEPFQSFSSFIEFKERIFKRMKLKKPLNKLRFHVRIILDNNVGILGITTFEEFYFVDRPSFKYKGDEYPFTPVSAVDILKEYIKAGNWRGGDDARQTAAEKNKEVEQGLPFLLSKITDKKAKQKIQDMQETLLFLNEDPVEAFELLIRQSEQGMEKWQRDLLRKRMVQLTSFDLKSELEQQEQLLSITEKHKRVFERLMSETENLDAVPAIYFTRSGLSANAAAMYFARQILGEDLRVTAIDGWYFENNPPKNWASVEVKDANLLLVSLEPNSPQFERNESEFFAYRDNQLRIFLERVTRNPIQKFVLVVDKTVNLINHSYFSKKDLPKNLLVVETASITKHQRGGRVNFYGLLSVWGNRDSEMVNTAITAVAGNLTPDTVFSFPRLTGSEIKRNLAQMKKSSDIFKEEFDKTQEKVVQSRRWRWQCFSDYGFILPPEEALKKFGEGDKYYEWFIASSVVLSSINNFIYFHPEYSIDKGDSFGLTQTRITKFGSPFPNTKNSKFNLTFIRVGFGTHTSEDQVREFAREVSERIVEESKKHW